MLSDNLLQAKMVPPSVRAYAATCQATNINPRKTGSWRLELEDVTLERPIKGASCIYSVGNLTLNSSRGPGARRIVSEGTLTVKTPLPEGIQLVAPKVVLHCPVRASIQIYADVIVSHAALTAFWGVRSKPCIHVFQPTSIPHHLRDLTIYQYDAPRKDLPDGATLTTEKIGFSIWHLIALGLFEKDVIDEFLSSLSGVEQAVLTLDIKETMSVLNENLKDEREKLGLPGLDWEEIKALVAWRSTYELCIQTRRPFLSAYKYDQSLVPPLINGLIRQTTSKLAPSP